MFLGGPPACRSLSLLRAVFVWPCLTLTQSREFLSRDDVSSQEEAPEKLRPGRSYPVEKYWWRNSLYAQSANSESVYMRLNRAASHSHGDADLTFKKGLPILCLTRGSNSRRHRKAGRQKDQMSSKLPAMQPGSHAGSQTAMQPGSRAASQAAPAPACQAWAFPGAPFWRSFSLSLSLSQRRRGSGRETRPPPPLEPRLEFQGRASPRADGGAP